MAREGYACSFPPNSIPQPHTWLLVCHGKHRQTQTFYSISQGHRVVRTIPELRNKAIWTFCDEWLVLADYKSSQLSLLSLVSMETTQLPKLEEEFDPYYSCILSSPPTSLDCRVVVFMGYPHCRILYCKPGDSEFKVKDFEIGNRYFCDSVASCGTIYALLVPFNFLYAIDFNTEKEEPRLIPLTLTEFPAQGPADIQYNFPKLVESNGDILFITVLYYGTHLHYKEIFGFVINRFDSAKKEWVQLKSLGETRALFLSTFWAVTCLASEETGVKGNCIYFVKDHDRCVYVFDLEKKTISFSMPCPDVNRRRSRFSWINLPRL